MATDRKFVPLKTGYVVAPIKGAEAPQGGDTHDTFKADSDGNVSDLHTTVRIPGGKSSWPRLDSAPGRIPGTLVAEDLESRPGQI